MMSFIEKIVVLQNRKGSIIRLYIDHDGRQDFSIQRSNQIKGRTSHFFNKKLWHSRYHVNLILERQIAQYEDKGYEIVEEFSLDPQPFKVDQFRFDNHALKTNMSMMKISHNAIPLSISASFQQLSIVDMRYKKPVVNADIWNLFEQLTRMICFVPLICTAIYEPDTQKLILLSTHYNSLPKPTAAYSVESLLQRADTTIELSHFECQTMTANSKGVFAHFDNQILTFHFPGWRVANLIVERNSPRDPQYNLYSFKNDVHCLIGKMKLDIEHNQHALFLLDIAENNKVKQAVYVERSERTKAISDMRYIVPINR
ncbi:hypothetical protein [Shewanella aestuarii]|uniref:Uncharacterized protein n=1 Tax=Shewanella aestuarii TaxID=1028752 RepID=A0A6G9QQF9_9GAMM|nr:hypothetical protein [Shewanella aestuarii]QIR16305.1 hypothetical protein HBH39_17620 [Shewanella aestuarii]